MNPVVVILGLSILAQTMAAALALRMISITGKRLPWLLFLLVIVLMALRRVLTLHGAITTGEEPPPALFWPEVTALVISLAMAGGIALVAPLFRTLFSARDELKRERDFAQTLIRTSPAFFVSMDAEGNVLFFNEALLDALGYAAHEVVGLPYLENFVPEEERPAVKEIFDRILTGDDVLEGSENHVVGRDGRRLLVRWHGRPIFDDQGNPHFFFGVGIDVTGERSLAKQLRQAQKMEAVGRLAGGIAHDFNNILTTVLGHAEMLQRKLVRNSPEEKSAERIAEAARKASELTERLLVFSRRQVVDRKVLNLDTVVGELEPILHRTLGDDIEYRRRSSASLWNVRAEPTQLEQVLLNLAINARDAMPRGGRLEIETANLTVSAEYALGRIDLEPGRYVLLRVSDSGTGMTEEVQARIFEPFYTTKSETTGTGLGLAIVYGVVRSAGGSIEVDSELGQGTTFQIYLPAVDEQVETTSVVSANRVTHAGQGETILVVEDNDGVRELAVAILEEAGYRVMEAPDPSRALALLSGPQVEVDLLLTDIIMPGMSGPELARRVEDIRPRMRVLYMSGYTDDGSGRVEAPPVGAPFVQKPFAAETLLGKVQEALEIPGATTARR